MDELTKESMDTLDSAIKKHKPKKSGLKWLGIGAGAALAAGLAYAAVPNEEVPEYEPGQLVVHFEEELELTIEADGNLATQFKEVNAINDMLSGESYRQMAVHSDEDDWDEWYLVDMDDSIDLNNVMKQFENANGVEWVGYNLIMGIPDLPEVMPYEGVSFGSEEGKIPNDKFYHTSGSIQDGLEDLWALRRAGAADAWELTTGDRNIVFAIVDTGIADDHPDLIDNMWRNPGEIAGDGIDNDNDGFIDNLFGANTIDPMRETRDGHGHGTHVGGTVAGVGDNTIGVAGVNWEGQLMAVKVLSDSGSGNMFGIASGIVFAARNGADVINMSLGGPASPMMLPVDLAIRYATHKGVITVVAAGNSDRNSKYFSPADHPHAITVAALDPDMNRAFFSNYGKLVDVGAPGMWILSTVPENHQIPDKYPVIDKIYAALHGTSMASPHVAGEVGLILAVRPDLKGDYKAVREIVRLGVEPYSEVDRDKPIGTGSINYLLAVEEAIKYGK